MEVLEIIGFIEALLRGLRRNVCQPHHGQVSVVIDEVVGTYNHYNGLVWAMIFGGRLLRATDCSRVGDELIPYTIDELRVEILRSWGRGYLVSNSSLGLETIVPWLSPEARKTPGLAAREAFGTPWFPGGMRSYADNTVVEFLG